MARPEKEKELSRSHHITLRLTETQYQPKSRIIVERKNWDITFPVFVKIIDLYL